MEFRLLGGVEASIDGQGIELGHARQRCLLAALLMEANRPVSTDRLFEYAWGDNRSGRSQNTLYSYVSRLRRLLAPAETVRLTRRSGGYLLEIDEDVVDLHRFRRLVRQARAVPRDDEAVALYDQALALWRAEAFSGLDTPWIASLRASLDNERFAAELDHADRALRSGQHATLLPVLSARADRHPLDERVAGQLLVALYRCGRQADALRAYQRIRQCLAEELGTDPGGDLQSVHRQILRGDAGLPARAPDTPTSPRSTQCPGGHEVLTPQQLPASPRWFSGRAAELATINRSHLVDDSDAVPVVVISGPGGVGKTWLALRWAHQRLDRFPDGQLFVNLRGFAPSGSPMSTATAVRGFLDALGVVPASIPLDLDAQVGLYRSLVAGRRMLIVLDNARDTSQVVDLLPGTSTCTVLVTSRDRLVGLVSGQGARPLPVDVLSDGEARELLIRRLGKERLAKEQDQAAALLAACAGLPLALGIAAARAAVQPELDLAAIVAELRDASTRLGALDGDDTHASVRTALSGSVRALAPRQAKVFALLGGAAGPDISLPAAAALTGLPLHEAAEALWRLERQSLLQQYYPGRWRMHDLVRLYAGDQFREQPTGVRRAAQLRLVDYFLHTGYAAARLLAPHRPPITLGKPVAGGHPQQLLDQASAEVWLSSEYACLVAAQNLALQQGLRHPVWQLAWALQTFQHRRGYLHDKVEVWQNALAAVQPMTDPIPQIRVRRALGRAYAEVASHVAAVEQLQQALTLAERAGDLSQRADTELALARACELSGDDELAFQHATEALRLHQRLKDPVREAVSRNAVGWHSARLGRYEQAAVQLHAALDLHTRHHDRTYQADTLDSLGYLAFRTGHYIDALTHYERAGDLFRELGDTYGLAGASAHLGDTHAALGHYDQARRAWQRAVELYRAQQRTDDADRLERQLRTAPVSCPVGLIGVE